MSYPHATGPEHYVDAETLINLAHNEECTPEEQMLTLAEAQVHATLALIATVEQVVGGLRGGRRRHE